MLLSFTPPAHIFTPPAHTAPAPFQSFSGDYTGKQDGGTIKLLIKQASDGVVTGTFNDGSSSATLAGKISDDSKKITGQFTYQGINLPFEIRRKGGQIEFVMKLGNEEEVMTLTRSGGAAPEEPPTKVPKTAAATGSGFTHPAGLALNLPKGWKVQQSSVLTTLLPPGASKADGDEIYLLLVGDANGIQSKSDPRLGQFMELILNGAKGTGGLILGPGITFQRTGSEKGDLTFTGSNGRGSSVYVRCIFSEPQGRIAAILAVGLKTKITAREAALQSSMASVKGTSPEHDSRLLGSWKGTTRTNSRDARDAVGRLKASSVSDSSTTYQLTGEGRFVESRHSRTIALGPGGVSLDSGDTVERTQGQWAASNGKIAFSDDNGLYLLGTYQLQGGAVVIQIGDRVITLSRG